MRWLAAFVVFVTGILCFYMVPGLKEAWDNVLYPMVSGYDLDPLLRVFLQAQPIIWFGLLLFAMFYLMFVKKSTGESDRGQK